MVNSGRKSKKGNRLRDSLRNQTTRFSYTETVSVLRNQLFLLGGRAACTKRAKGGTELVKVLQKIAQVNETLSLAPTLLSTGIGCVGAPTCT